MLDGVVNSLNKAPASVTEPDVAGTVGVGRNTTKPVEGDFFAERACRRARQLRDIRPREHGKGRGRGEGEDSQCQDGDE